MDNQGVPGELVTDPGTFPRFTGLTSSGAYDVVLLMEGANDLGNRSNAQIIVALNAMIDYARNQRLQVFLATIPPQNVDGCDPQCRGLEAGSVPLLNLDIAGLASRKGLPLVDVYQAFGGDLTKIGGDGLHPTADGYKLIADTFFAKITQTFNYRRGRCRTVAGAAAVCPAALPLALICRIKESLCTRATRGRAGRGLRVLSIPFSSRDSSSPSVPRASRSRPRRRESP